MFFPHLPFPYYFVLLFFYIFIYLTDMSLNGSMWDIVPWLGNETGSHQTWESSYPCFIWWEHLFVFPEDIVFYGQEYLISKHTIVCFFSFSSSLCFDLFLCCCFSFCLLFLFCLIYVNESKVSFFSSLFIFRDEIPKSWVEAECVGKSVDKHLTTQKGLAALASFGSFLEIQNLWSHHKLQI